VIGRPSAAAAGIPPGHLRLGLGPKSNAVGHH
jgi:hypothetical protein